ncbi:cytochrome P450 3A6-like [Haliotis rubra]|uniref:cytochrome P450 3A6-like n=1 Tax=Haliotis rubra TaxID=36100 RepID=UPI001EE5A486|nr:cytochrome P450 3A6-like [Haliotis rubra]
MELLTWLLTALTPLLVTLVGILAIVYMYVTWSHDYFRKLGIPGPKPGLTGNMGNYKKAGVIGNDVELVRKYGRVVGIYHCRLPIMLVSDPEMIKEICVKQFSNFTNRKRPEPINKVFKSAVSVVEDDHWKFSRSVLSPTFSSGKMRQMVPLIQKCTASLVQNLERQSRGGGSVEMKNVMGCYTLDVIASTGFGMEVNSQENPRNVFVKNAKEAMSASFTFPYVTSLLFPFMRDVFEALGWSFMSKNSREFFFNVMDKAIDDRRQNPSDRRDLLQLMLNTHTLENKMEADDVQDAQLDFSKIRKRPLTNDEIMSNSVVFMLAGYDTTSGALSFASYLLATNLDCQDKLIQEIDQHLGKDLATYDNVMNLPYLERVFLETLRLYPPASRFSRMAKNDITIKGYLIKAGTSVNFPIYAMHHDPEFWKEPEKFQPDRFLPENKTAMHDYCFAPFGVGPRNCVGMRLAFLEFKMALVTVLQHFRFRTAPDTEIPPKLEKGGFVRALNGIYLRVDKRT